jgi:hypothetical protein
VAKDYDEARRLGVVIEEKQNRARAQIAKAGW